MLDGWYCRTLANEQAQAGGSQPEEPNIDVDDSDSDSQTAQKATGAENVTKPPNGTQIDYKSQYRYLKRKLKFLIYENEFFQDALRSNQRRLLKVSRDRAFLLDRLLQYEKPDDTSDSDATESSEDEVAKEPKKRKTEPGSNTNNSSGSRGRKRKLTTDGPPQQKSAAAQKNPSEIPNIVQQTQQIQQHSSQQQPIQQQQHPLQQRSTAPQPGHMTAAEVERHLQSRQLAIELMPEQASATVPTEMFSNEPSLDSEPHEHLMDGSPSHVAAEECVTMEYAN